MMRIVFLLEERSMQVLLDNLLPRLFPDIAFQCVPHEGKSDLEKSLPRKLKAWREPGVRFCVLRDNDGADCTALKRHLVDLCREAGREDTVVRLACQELEAWYLGDPEALARAFEDERLGDVGNQARYRDPDVIKRPSEVLSQLVPPFQKVSGARRMAKHLSRESNRSRSFLATLQAIERLHFEIQEGGVHS
jgi:hypothetical protein